MARSIVNVITLALACLFLVQNTAAAILPFNNLSISNELEKVTSEQFNLNSLTEQWMDTCAENNGTEAVEDIQDSLHNLYFCISSKINVANLFKEMEAATPIGALDEVFTQYCDQIPELMNCAEKVTDAMSVCLGDQGKEDLKTFVGVVDAALEFLCYKGGERIAIFLAEKGSECLVSSVDRLMGCLNESLPSFTNVLDNMHSLNLSIYDPANCKVEVQVKGCVVDALKSCSDPTPSNVIEGLMNSMERATPCFVPSFASTFTTTWLYSLLVGLLLPLRSIANRY